MLLRGKIQIIDTLIKQFDFEPETEAGTEKKTMKRQTQRSDRERETDGRMSHGRKNYIQYISRAVY